MYISTQISAATRPSILNFIWWLKYQGGQRTSQSRDFNHKEHRHFGQQRRTHEKKVRVLSIYTAQNILRNTAYFAIDHNRNALRV